MPTMCIQCTMRAMLNNKPTPTFNETPEQHQRRVHPDLVDTNKERQELERRLADRFRKAVGLKKLKFEKLK